MKVLDLHVHFCTLCMSPYFSGTRSLILVQRVQNYIQTCNIIDYKQNASYNVSIMFTLTYYSHLWSIFTRYKTKSILHLFWLYKHVGQSLCEDIVACAKFYPKSFNGPLPQCHNVNYIDVKHPVDFMSFTLEIGWKKVYF